MKLKTIILFLFILAIPCSSFADLYTCAEANAQSIDLNRYTIYAGCYPTQAQAQAAVGGTMTGFRLIGNCDPSCGEYQGVGIWYRFGESTMFTKYAIWDLCGCPAEQDDAYCVLAIASCLDGTPVAVEYVRCQDNVPTDDVGFCGNSTYYNLMVQALADGHINYPACNCDLTMADIQSYCAMIDPSTSDCGYDCLQDDDGDGVNNCDDRCPNTPAGTTVNANGCDINANDDDGDGVTNDVDQCPDTSPGAYVDVWGCSIGNYDTDDDGDGVPDDIDLEPNTPPGSTVDSDGRAITPTIDENATGDQDNDNELLTGIISWLKKLWGTEEQIKTIAENTQQDTEAIKNQLEETEHGQDDVASNSYGDQNAFDNGLNAEIDAVEDIFDDADNPSILNDYPILTDEINLYDEIVDVINNNPVSNALNGVELQATGNCYFDWDYKGRNVRFSVCEYAATLNSWGSIILMIVSVHSLIMIFRR